MDVLKQSYWWLLDDANLLLVSAEEHCHLVCSYLNMPAIMRVANQTPNFTLTASERKASDNKTAPTTTATSKGVDGDDFTFRVLFVFVVFCSDRIAITNGIERIGPQFHQRSSAIEAGAVKSSRRQSTVPSPTSSPPPCGFSFLFFPLFYYSHRQP